MVVLERTRSVANATSRFGAVVFGILVVVVAEIALIVFSLCGWRSHHLLFFRSWAWTPFSQIETSKS